jgi:hypothetical protein
MALHWIDETVAELRARWPGAMVEARHQGPLHVVFDVAFGHYGRTRLTVWHYICSVLGDVQWACDAWHRDDSAAASERASAVAAAEGALVALVTTSRARADEMAERVGRLLASAERGGQ